MIRYLKVKIKKIYSIFKKNLFLKNVTKKQFTNDSLKKRALLYYKTDIFTDDQLTKKYTHTNNWEVKEIANQLDSLGFVVDLVDRQHEFFIPKNNYDIFIGLAGCGSGRFFGKYASRLKKAIKIAYLTTSHPEIMDQCNKLRYEWFHNRTGISANRMRIDSSQTYELSNDLKKADYFFLINDNDSSFSSFSSKSYKKFLNKKTFFITPSTKPELGFKSSWLERRDIKSFCCFVGSGFIHKGVDLLVEAFLLTPNLKLTICGPDSDKAFFKYYKKKIDKNSNIKFEGFINVGSEKFYNIASSHSFVILYSSSESCNTSITTMLRVGLVPVINYETGIDSSEIGFLINEHKNDQNKALDNICYAIRTSSLITKKKYKNLVLKTLKYSDQFTQKSFTKTLKASLVSVLSKNL